jgi:hypothetical protein
MLFNIYFTVATIIFIFTIYLITLYINILSSDKDFFYLHHNVIIKESSIRLRISEFMKNKFFNIVIIFIAGFITRMLFNGFFGINVFVDYDTVLSLFYYLNFSVFVA